MFDLTAGERRALLFICCFLLLGAVFRTGFFYKSKNKHSEQIYVSQQKININTATSAQLQKIKGIGPALAEKIIEYRSEKGDFQSEEDLTKVSGIGTKKLEYIKNFICL